MEANRLTLRRDHEDVVLAGGVADADELVVGEEPLADAVRAVARLPRARVLVLAGALMGGAITDAVAS